MQRKTEELQHADSRVQQLRQQVHQLQDAQDAAKRRQEDDDDVHREQEAVIRRLELDNAAMQVWTIDDDIDRAFSDATFLPSRVDVGKTAGQIRASAAVDRASSGAGGGSRRRNRREDTVGATIGTPNFAAFYVDSFISSGTCDLKSSRTYGNGKFHRRRAKQSNETTKCSARKQRAADRLCHSIAR